MAPRRNDLTSDRLTGFSIRQIQRLVHEENCIHMNQTSRIADRVRLGFDREFFAGPRLPLDMYRHNKLGSYRTAPLWPGKFKRCHGNLLASVHHPTESLAKMLFIRLQFSIIGADVAAVTMPGWGILG